MSLRQSNKMELISKLTLIEAPTSTKGRDIPQRRITPNMYGNICTVESNNSPPIGIELFMARNEVSKESKEE
jgi:hypothetical protein